MIRSDALILAAGTLGNFRILASSDVTAAEPSLGAGLTDHVSSVVATFDIRIPMRFRRRAAPTFHAGVLGSPRLIPGLSTGRRLGGYAHWQVDPPSWLPLDEAKAILSGRPRKPSFRSTKRVGSHLPQLVNAAVGATRLRQRPVLGDSKVSLRVDVQQIPSPGNRLSWDADTKTVGVDWDVTETDRTTIQDVTAAVLADLDLELLGLELTDLPDLAPHDTFHMMGGVMSSRLAREYWRPAAGLHVLGAGSFPTGGMANPTFTALAIAEIVTARWRDLAC